MDMHRVPAEARMTFYGKTIDEIVATATIDLDKLFGGSGWQFVEITARPYIATVGRGISLWEADIEAKEVLQ